MKEPKKKCLITVQGPLQFLAGYIAFRWCEDKIWLQKTDVTLLIYDTCVPIGNEVLFQNTIKEIANIHKFHKIIFLNQLQSIEISKNKYSKALTKLRSLIENDNFNYLVVARDFGGFVTKLIPNAYPSAVKVEYGDSFGLVGNKNYLEGSAFDILRSPIIYLKAEIKKIFYSQYLKKYLFNLSVLTMPLVWDKKYLVNKKIIIPDQLFVKTIVSQLSAQMINLKNYSDELLSNSNNNCNLYLLSNLYKSGFCTFESEFNLYEEIILETALPGQKIILKNHPRGDDEMLIHLKNKLNILYDVQLITDVRFSFIPIELWNAILNRCNIFPIYSTSAISLKYLYSKQVTLTLDAAKVNKYLYTEKRAGVNDGINMIYTAIKTLENWDYKSPLWIKN